MIWAICVVTFTAGVITGIVTFALMNAAKKADENMERKWWNE